MEPHAEARERVDSALPRGRRRRRRAALETRFAEGSDGLRESAAGRTTSSIRQTRSPELERPLEAVGRAVLLCLVADDDEGEAGASEADAARTTAPSTGQASRRRLGLEVATARGQPLPERLEHVGLRLEAELVEVVLRPAPERSTKSPSRYPCSTSARPSLVFTFTPAVHKR